MNLSEEVGCLRTRVAECSYMGIGSVAIPKLYNAAFALGWAFKSSFVCQVSWHMENAKPAHSAHMEDVKLHCYMDFFKARRTFQEPAVG